MSGGVTRGQFSGDFFWNSHGRCAGPSAGDQGESETSGTSVLYALRMCGWRIHPSRDVSLNWYCISPSGPGSTEPTRDTAGRTSFTAVPGGTLGTAVKLVRPAVSRVGSVLPGPDGLMQYQFNETSREGWMRQPHIRNAYKTLVPLVSDSPWSPALGPAHLPWLFQKKAPENWPRTTPPDMWICYRTNPAISSWNAPEIAERLAEFPFIVAFSYTEDETNHFADILLPEALDLESTQIIRIGSTKFTEQFWKHEGWAIRQPAVESPCDTMSKASPWIISQGTWPAGAASVCVGVEATMCTLAPRRNSVAMTSRASPSGSPAARAA